MARSRRRRATRAPRGPSAGCWPRSTPIGHGGGWSPRRVASCPGTRPSTRDGCERRAWRSGTGRSCSAAQAGDLHEHQSHLRERIAKGRFGLAQPAREAFDERPHSVDGERGGRLRSAGPGSGGSRPARTGPSRGWRPRPRVALAPAGGGPRRSRPASRHRADRRADRSSSSSARSSERSAPGCASGSGSTGCSPPGVQRLLTCVTLTAQLNSESGPCCLVMSTVQRPTRPPDPAIKRRAVVDRSAPGHPSPSHGGVGWAPGAWASGFFERPIRNPGGQSLATE